MKPTRIKRLICAAAVFLTAVLLSACSSQPESQKKPVRVLILPKFEVGAMTNDFPGEAQYFYEGYLAGGETYEIDGCPDTVELFYKDGIAMCLAGQGKVASALNTSAVLSDERFDFSEAYVLSVGCGGTAEGYGILGDVFVITSAADYDLGHHADPREMGSEPETTWFHDESFDTTAFIRLNQALCDHVYALIENIQLNTTEKSARYLNAEYPDEAWAQRQPRVMRGTSVTGDNYWKGIYGHQNALRITEFYGCADPYAITEMEDIAVAQAVRQAGLLDRLIILRVAVNMDVFPSGVTAETVWAESAEDHIASENSMESIDIFEAAMQNCFDAGRILIDAILEGTLE